MVYFMHWDWNSSAIIKTKENVNGLTLELDCWKCWGYQSRFMEKKTAI
jgi:hypothetical protein